MSCHSLQFPFIIQSPHSFPIPQFSNIKQLICTRPIPRTTPPQRTCIYKLLSIIRFSFFSNSHFPHKFSIRLVFACSYSRLLTVLSTTASFRNSLFIFSLPAFPISSRSSLLQCSIFFIA